jgi:hypothetical protein
LSEAPRAYHEDVPVMSDLTTAGFGDDAQHRHCLERCRGDSTADVADYGGLTGHEAEYIDGVDAGIDATDDHRLHRRLIYVGLLGYFGVVRNAAMRPPGIAFIFVPVLVFLILSILGLRSSAGARVALAFLLWIILVAQSFRIVASTLVAAANKDPDFGGIFTLFNAGSPSVYADIDRVKAEKVGLTPTDVFPRCRFISLTIRERLQLSRQNLQGRYSG